MSSIDFYAAAAVATDLFLAVIARRCVGSMPTHVCARANADIAV